jgi:hypothetical protein
MIPATGGFLFRGHMLIRDLNVQNKNIQTTAKTKFSCIQICSTKVIVGQVSDTLKVVKVFENLRARHSSDGSNRKSSLAAVAATATTAGRGTLSIYTQGMEQLDENKQECIDFIENC